MNIQQALPEVANPIQTPVWNDECKHGRECYIGSFQLAERSFDVYVYSSPISSQDVCIRYSDKPSEYYSPGTILDLLITGVRLKWHVYLMAFDLISKAGQIRWTRNQ